MSETTRIPLVPAAIPAADNNTIADFLAKPIVVKSGTLSTADTLMTQKEQFSISTELYNNPIWADKLRGYRFISATAHVKVVINANPFQCGRLITTFLPMYRHHNASEKAIRNVNMAQITTQPNVELNIQDSSSEMIIPYVTPQPYYDKLTGWFDWGTVFLYVLSPLRTGSGGETTAFYDIFLSFSDVKLAAPMQPESGLSGLSGKTRLNRTVVSLKSSESAQVSDNKPSTIVENIGSLASSVSNSIFSYIPGVTAVAGVVQSAAGSAASTLKAFGWAKPLVESPAQPILQRPFFQYQNATSGVASDALAVSHAPLLDPNAQVFGSNVDEMSLAYLKTKEAWRNTSLWTIDNAADTVVFSLDLTIKNLITYTSRNALGWTDLYMTGSPVFVLANMFQYSRGSIEISLQFVKTMMHSGRVLVTFTPSEVPGDISAMTTAKSPYVLREIVDLKTSDSLSLKIPWLKPYSYMNRDDSKSYGRLDVTVLTRLRAPETASGTVEVLTYVRPGDDFELAVPTVSKAMVYSPESGLSSSRSLISKVIGNAKILEPSLLHNDLCIADPILSIKQLLVQARKVVMNIRDDDNQPLPNLLIDPFCNGLVSKSSVSEYVAPFGTLMCDWYSLLSPAYALMRGGARIINTNVVTETSTEYTSLAPAYQYGVQDATPLVPLYFWNSDDEPNLNRISPPIHYTRSGISGALDVLMPYYSETPSRAVRQQSAALPDIDRTEPGSPSLVIFTSGANKGAGTWYRAMADDFALGYFIGFPPIAFLRSVDP